MVTGKRIGVLVIGILAIGALLSACGSDDCWNNCQNWGLMCRQNCNAAWPAYGPEWETCTANCNLETVACQNECFWGEDAVWWW